jgi:hypothetical protein
MPELRARGACGRIMAGLAGFQKVFRDCVEPASLLILRGSYEGVAIGALWRAAHFRRRADAAGVTRQGAGADRFRLGGPGGGRQRHARFAQQPATRRAARSDGQHDGAAAALLWRCHAQRLGDHRAIHVSGRRLSPPDRPGSGWFARYRRDPRARLPLAALPEAMEAAAKAGNLECVVAQP